jgi:hypothetical protein
MRPVNIPFDQHIATERFDAAVDKRHGHEAATLE